MTSLALPTVANTTSFDQRLLIGIGFGLIAAIAWSGYTVASRAAVENGFTAWDLTAIRFFVAGLVLLPVVARRGFADLAGVGWGRGAILALGAGPVFSGLYTYGLSMTPYTHGPVISPSVVTIGALGLAALFLGERIGAWRVLGTITVLAGLVLVAGGDFLTPEGPAFSAYDLLFVGSGLLWASYTVLLRRWRIDPIAATTAVAVVSAIALTPAYLATADITRLFSNPSTLLFHAAMQGLVAAVIAVIAFSKAVELLGAGRAGLFPALVPVLAVVFGMPLLDEWPTSLQATGVAVATVGLTLASGVVQPRQS